MRRVRSAAPEAESDQSIQQQQRHGSDDGHPKTGGLSGGVPAQRAPDPPAEPTAGHTDDRGDDETARVGARKQELGDDSNHQTNQRMADHVKHVDSDRTSDAEPAASPAIRRSYRCKAAPSMVNERSRLRTVAS